MAKNILDMCICQNLSFCSRYTYTYLHRVGEDKIIISVEFITNDDSKFRFNAEPADWFQIYVVLGYLSYMSRFLKYQSMETVPNDTLGKIFKTFAYTRDVKLQKLYNSYRDTLNKLLYDHVTTEKGLIPLILSYLLD